MNPIATLRALAAGEATGGLLADCRFDGFGTAAYGPAAITAIFRRHPFVIAPTPHIVVTDGAVALFDAGAAGPVAFIADVVDGHLARLWRVGPHGGDELREAAIAVPADSDCHQVAPTVLFAASDHPWLDPSAAAALVQVGGDVAAGAVSSRSRAVCLRAFSAGGCGAALFVRLATPDDGVRRPDQRWVAADFRWRGDHPVQQRVVVDAPVGHDWTPRF